MEHATRSGRGAPLRGRPRRDRPPASGGRAAGGPASDRGEPRRAAPAGGGAGRVAPRHDARRAGRLLDRRVPRRRLGDRAADGLRHRRARALRPGRLGDDRRQPQWSGRGCVLRGHAPAPHRGDPRGEGLAHASRRSHDALRGVRAAADRLSSPRRHSLGRRGADLRRRPAVGDDRRGLAALPARPARSRGTPVAVRRARGDRDRQRREPRPADRLPRPAGRNVGRDAPAHRARPARRHAAAPGVTGARPARRRGQRAARAARACAPTSTGSRRG